MFINNILSNDNNLESIKKTLINSELFVLHKFVSNIYENNNHLNNTIDIIRKFEYYNFQFLIENYLVNKNDLYKKYLFDKKILSQPIYSNNSSTKNFLLQSYLKIFNILSIKNTLIKNKHLEIQKEIYSKYNISKDNVVLIFLYDFKDYLNNHNKHFLLKINNFIGSIENTLFFQKTNPILNHSNKNYNNLKFNDLFITYLEKIKLDTQHPLSGVKQLIINNRRNFKL